MKIAKPLQNVIDSFHKLPGIGPKTAERLGYYLLHVPQSELDSFGESLVKLKKDTVLCEICKNVAETSPCPICTSSSRDQSIVMVVEQPLDLIAFEGTAKFAGLYHVLHGAINPLENIGPDEIFINDLIARITANQNQILEIIIATNPTMEGEATSMYLAKKIKELANGHPAPKVTRLGLGIPTGADLEYADPNTLFQSLEGRREL